MKRTFVVIALLLFVAGLLYVWHAASEDSGRARHDHAHVPNTDGTSDHEDRDATAGDARPAGDRFADDDDPNRVDGPPLFVRGRVVDANGAPVPRATVEALRAPSVHETANFRWNRPLPTLVAAPVARAEADGGGLFEIGFARRLVVVLRATAPGHAPATLRVLLPATGDLADVTLRLGEAAALHGVVVGKDDEPIAGALVRLLESDRMRAVTAMETTTDEQGRFAFADLKPAAHRLFASADGHGTVRRWATPSRDNEMRIVLEPAGVVEGTVTRHDGTPVSGATVAITTHDEVDVAVEGFASATTDEQGRYRMEDVQPGFVAHVALDHPTVGSLDTRGALPLPVATVAAGEATVHDIELPSATAVAGIAVLAETGAPAARARLTLLRMDERYRRLLEAAHAVADDAGRFVFPFVTEGSYAIEARGDDAARLVVRFPDNQRPLVHDFYADGATTPSVQRVELASAGAIHGRVVGLPERPNGLGVNLETKTGQLSADIDDRLHFRFRHVPVTPEATVRAWNPQLPSVTTAVEPGRVATVTLDANAGRVFRGRILDDQGRPLKGARVLATPTSAMRWQLEQFLRYRGWGGVATDAAGEFRHPIPEWVQKRAHKEKWSVLAKYEGYLVGEEGGISVPDGGEPAPVEITLQRGGIVTGRVELEGGGPVPGINVHLSPRKKRAAGDRRPSLRATTDHDGRFEVRGVGEGPYWLSATSHEGKVEGREVTAGATELRLVLRRTVSIRGLVVDADGRPLEGASIAAIVPRPNGERRHNGFVRAGGRFQINNLEEGSYVIEVRPSPNANRGGGFLTKRTPPIATGTTDVRIQVEEGPRLRGRVVDASGRGVVGAAVIAMPLKADGNRSAQRPFARTDGTGAFEMSAADAGVAELVAMKSGYQVTSARAAPGDPPVTIRLQPGESLELLFVLPDGTPYKNGWCSMQPASDDVRKRIEDLQKRGGQTWNNLMGWSLLQGRTDGDGVFRLGGLFPGKYRLWINSTDGVLENNLVEAGRGRTTLQLRTPLSISGRVVDPSGKPLANYRAALVVARQGTRTLGATRIAEDGAFTIDRLPGGEITLSVQMAGVVSQPTVVEAGSEGVRLAFVPLEKKKSG